MTNITRSLVAIVIRGGIEIWVEKEKAVSLAQALSRQDCPQFIRYGEQLINKADITGIFSPQVMEEKVRRRNGMWQCQSGTWHDRGEKCGCLPLDEKELKDRINTAIKNCGKCKNGYIETENGMAYCECIKEFKK